MADHAAVIKELVERIEATLAVGSEWVNMPLDLVQYAVHMLEEHEPLLIKRDTVDEIYNYVAECPNCGIHFSAWEDEKIRFCPGCGKAVKWDG